MPVIKEPLTDKEQTVNRIFELAKTYSSDLDDIFILKSGRRVSLASLSLKDFFDFVKKIPYRRDVKPIEIVARPRIIVERYLNGQGRDCKKAAVLLGAYFEKKKFPWRLATISNRQDKQIHHIFPQVDYFFNGHFLNADATYSDMRLFDEKEVTKVEYFQ